MVWYGWIGHMGCIEPSHLIRENQRINLDRNQCYAMVTCLRCAGNIIGNQCLGHVGSYQRCLVPTKWSNPCTCVDWTPRNADQ
jgi:hypothetical protein